MTVGGQLIAVDIDAAGVLVAIEEASSRARRSRCRFER
jgi:hypothetical protein